MSASHLHLVPRVFAITLLVLTTTAFAEEPDVETLRREIETQRLQLEQQQALLQQQAEQLKRLESTVNSLTSSSPVSSVTPAPSTSVLEVDADTDETPPVSTTRTAPIVKSSTSDILDKSTIAGLGRGEEFIDDDFLKSVPLFGSDWRFSFGGYVKVDLIHDFAGSGDSSQFLISEIPVDGNPQPGSYSEFQMRETRFNFEVRNTLPGEPESKFFTEFDFFGGSNSSNPRLRHAYFQYGNLLVGQTWTTLTELRQLPLFLDFAAGDSLFGGRTVQIRWEQEIDRNFDWAIALEDYDDSGIENPNGLFGVARANFPLLVGRIGYDWDQGLVMLGGSVGENRWDGTGSVADDSELRWNIATGSRIYLTDHKTHFLGFGGSYGQGAPRQILTFGNAGTPSAVLDANGKLKNVTSWNANTGLHLQWPNKLSSNFGIAYARLGSTSLLPATSIRSGYAINSNIIYDFNDQIRTGLELIVGEQELVNGKSGSGERLQFSIFYYF